MAASWHQLAAWRMAKPGEKRKSETEISWRHANQLKLEERNTTYR